MPIRFIQFILILLAANSAVFAQTRVSGKVVDMITREPLPFVVVSLKGTNVSANTDFDGNYSLTSSAPSDSLIIIYIGYNRESRPILANRTQVINVELTASTTQLEEAVVIAGENPAHKIFRKVIAHKDSNDREKLAAYQYEVYNKIEFDLNNLTEDFKSRKIFKPFDFIFENIDSSNVKEKPHLPMFLTESLSDFFYRRDPKFKKEIIKASRIAGVQNESVSQFMGDMYQNVNVYDNNVEVFGKNFVSPISSNGLLYYKYYLRDSLYIDGNWCYHIEFKPKRKQELTFKGNMWIADTSFAIKRLEMSISADANINFISNFFVVQEYQQIEGKTWMLYKDRLVIDFSPQKRMMGVYGRKTTSYRNFVINQPKETTFFTETENLLVDKAATNKTDEFWKNNRHDSLTRKEQKIYEMVDQLQKVPAYRTWVDVITIFVSGYKIVGNYELGPYYNTLSFNRVEGTRLRFGGRTSNDFSKWYEISGYVAYGFKDEKFKYSFGMRSFISKKPRQMVGIYYKNDYEILGQSQNAFTQDNIVASLFRRNPLRSLTFVEQSQAYYEREWITGFNTRVSFFNRKLTPLDAHQYAYTRGDGTIGYKNFITTSEIRINSRFAYGEKYISGEFVRASLGTKYPVLQVQYTAGIKDVFNGDYNYHRINVNVNDRIRIGPLGYFDYILEYGKIWGKLPYPLMELHGGNETLTYDPYAYNMMNYYEFVSDEFATVSFYHHFDGLFLNKIPLLRKLKWREVATFKGLIGRVNDKNKQVLIFPSTLYNLNNHPYYETGVGIENIFKIFRLDALWRLSYLNNPNISRFGLRFSMQFIF